MVLGVEASQRTLEDVATPLTAQDAEDRDRSIDLRDRDGGLTSTGPAASSMRRYH
jgi:hypothetical protein